MDEVRCSYCQKRIGWLHGGDPYLPLIACDECHEKER